MKRFLAKAHLITLIRSIILSLSVSMTLFGLVNAGLRMLGQKVPLIVILISLGILFVIPIPLFFVKLKLTEYEVSKKIDKDYLLPETAKTMVEFQDFNVSMAELQRKVANDKLGTLKLKDFTIKIHIIDVIFLLGGIMILIFSFCFPVNEKDYFHPNNSDSSIIEEISESSEEESNSNLENSSESNNNNFSQDVQNKLDEAENVKNDSSLSKEEKIDKVNQIKQEISDIAKDENENQKAQEVLDKIKDEIQNEKNSDKSNDSGGQSSTGESGSKGDGKIIYAANDKIYDPKTNSYVEYGNIIDEYLKELINLNLTDEELQALISAYFSSLYYNEEEN